MISSLNRFLAINNKWRTSNYSSEFIKLEDNCGPSRDRLEGGPPHYRRKAFYPRMQQVTIRFGESRIAGLTITVVIKTTLLPIARHSRLTCHSINAFCVSPANAAITPTEIFAKKKQNKNNKNIKHKKKNFYSKMSTVSMFYINFKNQILKVPRPVPSTVIVGNFSKST